MCSGVGVKTDAGDLESPLVACRFAHLHGRHVRALESWAEAKVAIQVPWCSLTLRPMSQVCTSFALGIKVALHAMQGYPYGIHEFSEVRQHGWGATTPLNVSVVRPRSFTDPGPAHVPSLSSLFFGAGSGEANPPSLPPVGGKTCGWPRPSR